MIGLSEQKEAAAGGRAHMHVANERCGAQTELVRTSRLASHPRAGSRAKKELQADSIGNEDEGHRKHPDWLTDQTPLALHLKVVPTVLSIHQCYT